MSHASGPDPYAGPTPRQGICHELETQCHIALERGRMPIAEKFLNYIARFHQSPFAFIIQEQEDGAVIDIMARAQETTVAPPPADDEEDVLGFGRPIDQGSIDTDFSAYDRHVMRATVRDGALVKTEPPLGGDTLPPLGFLVQIARMRIAPDAEIMNALALAAQKLNSAVTVLNKTSTPT